MQEENSEVNKYICMLVFMLYMLLLDSIGADGIGQDL